MSEHIIEIPDYTSPFDPVARAVSLGEEIVRCRDCIKWHMCDVNEDGSTRGSCDEWTHLDGFTHTTRENGFCAWGERRDA